ncbi:MAG: hypothetical protein ATN34_01745 [Epulopiscium sp. Nele67-Bin002]|nr:MAG: hypothetical protein ATN34_01745 [Epulopiscium sp. Nele67-Bin002]
MNKKLRNSAIKLILFTLALGIISPAVYANEDTYQVQTISTISTTTDVAEVFNDVSTADWFYEDVANVYSLGLIMGVTADTFEPNTVATRAQLATIVHRMSNDPTVAPKTAFTDVPEDEWYTASVNWVTDANIFSGFEDGTFRPNELVTREQLIVVLYNLAQFQGIPIENLGRISTFSDSIDISAWSAYAMQWGIGNGIIGGKEDNMLDPKGGATRAEISATITRYSNLED